MIIAIDFDGTCVTHDFPNIGTDIGAVPVLKKLIAAGHQLVLHTMRSDKHDNVGYSEEVPQIHNGNFLSDAVNWSPKAYAQIYIDDAALGCPLIHPEASPSDISDERPYVDWAAIEKYFVERKLIQH